MKRFSKYGGTYTVKPGITIKELEEIAKDKDLDQISFANCVLKGQDIRNLEKCIFSKKKNTLLYIFNYRPENTNIEFLKLLPSLKKLSLNNLIVTTEIDKIEFPNNLEELSISECNVQVYEILKKINPKLKRLIIGKSLTAKLDLSFISRFSNLKYIYIEAHDKGIEEISKLKYLEEIVVRSISLPNINFLKNMASLWSVEIKLGGIKDFSALENMPNIKYLELWLIKGLKDISFISKMKGLQNLHLESLTNIKQLPSLEKLTNLRRIELMNLNGLETLNALKAAPRLQDFFFTEIKKMQPTDLIPVLENTNVKNLYIYFPSDRKNNEFNLLAKKYGKAISDFPDFIYEK